MSSTSDANQTARLLAEIACRAGAAALLMREFNAEVQAKPDGSPVTRADYAAERVAVDMLQRAFPGIAIVSEETPLPEFGAKHQTDGAADQSPAPVRSANHPLPQAGEGRRSQKFFLIDPIDGTREFIEGRDEFTVNIALIENGRPIAAAIAAPALRRAWYAGTAAFSASCDVSGAVLSPGAAIAARQRPDAPVGLISRSHADQASLDETLRQGIAGMRAIGSSLKFCLIASGEADFYARLAPVNEWDIAAGDAILTAAEGSVRSPSGEALLYRGRGDLIQGFIARGK